jgi:hypothetical protein
MPKPSDWCYLACVATVLAAFAAPAWAQQNGQAPAQANSPMFKEPLTTANLFSRGKNKAAQPQTQNQTQGQMQPQAGPAPFRKRFFEKLDTNGDGIVTRDEFLAQANRQFNALDLNHDGRLTPDEINAAVEKAQANADANANPNANGAAMDDADAGGKKRKRNPAPAQ